MGGVSPPAHNATGPLARADCVWAGLLLACALFLPVSKAAAEPHTESLAALADTRAAIAQIIQAEDQIANSPTPYRRAAQRAVNAIVGEGDRVFDKVNGNPGDAAGALGHVNALLDRRDSPPWVNTLHGVQVNLMAAVARLRDAIEARELDDYQVNVTSALLNLLAAVGQPTQSGVFGGLTGALATTTLGVPAGARQVSACVVPIAEGPAYGVKDGYLAFVVVPATAGTAGLPQDFGSRNISVQGDRLVVRTAAADIVARLCREPSAVVTPPRLATQAKADPPPQSDPPAPVRTADGGKPPALYTRAQAKAGRSVYLQQCVACHGKNLQGTLAPAVAGTDFLQTAQRNGWTLQIIRYLVVNTMPFHSPGTLSPKQYANVLAYLLAANCFPAGDMPFPQHDDEQFKKIDLHPLIGVRPDNNKFGTCRG